MSDMLLIGASGVRAYQSALSVVSENIANAGTAGYVKRNAQLNEIVQGPASASRTGTIGSGVALGGIERVADPLRAAQVRSSATDLSRSTAAVGWMERIEGAVSGNALSQKLTDFFNAATSLAADPTSSRPRAHLMETGTTLAQAFTATGEAMATLSADIDTTAKTAATDLGGLAKSLARINVGLANSSPGTNGQAQLLDERDRVLDKMSDLTAVSVKLAANGTATVRVGGSQGPLLVDRDFAGSIGYSRNADGVAAFTLDNIDGPVATFSPAGGVLGGVVEGTQRVADATREINRIATQFVADVNTAQAQGRDLDGGTGAPFFAQGTEPTDVTMVLPSTRKVAVASAWTTARATSNTSAVTVTADTVTGATPPANSRLSYSGGNLTLFDSFSGAAIDSKPYVAGQPVTLGGLQISLSGTPDEGETFTLAATGANSLDTGNLTRLQARRTAADYEGALNVLGTANALALDARRTIVDAQTAISAQAVAQRDELSGVNLDAETVSLIQFQQAYSASGRIIQAARDCFQTILDIR